MNKDENIDFLMTEFNTVHAYFISLEAKLSGIFSLFTTTFLTATGAFFYVYFIYSNPESKYVELLIFLSLFFILFGLYLVNAFAEIRIRKVKVLEQLALIREFFKNNNRAEKTDISKTLIMLVGLEKCPKYLRRPSDDWLTSIFMIVVNCIASGAFAYVLNIKYALIAFWPLIWFYILTSFILLFLLQFRYITKLYYTHDYEFERKYKIKRDYDFLSGPLRRGLLIKTLDYLASFIEKSEKERLDYHYKNENK